MLTFRHRPGVRHGQAKAHAPVTREPGLRDQARGHGDDPAPGLQVAAPPVGPQQLRELGLAVGVDGVAAGVSQQGPVEGGWGDGHH